MFGHRAWGRGLMRMGRGPFHRGDEGSGFLGLGEGFGRGMGRHGGGRRHGGRFFAQGGLRLVMLAMLAERPRHGYEIIKAIEDRMGGAYVPSAGVVYPTLTLLEETGQIEVAAADGAKKLYAITEAGRATLADNRAQVEAMMARMTEAGAARSGERDPRLVRAIENMRLALRLKLEGGGLDDTRIAALVALLDETASRIETL